MNSQNQTLVGITKTYLEGGNGKRERENKAAQRIPPMKSRVGSRPQRAPLARTFIVQLLVKTSDFGASFAKTTIPPRALKAGVP
jgi:hypothetical protein